MRIFTAFPIPTGVKKELVKTQTEIGRLNSSIPIKWTEEWNMHVTLDFLGELEETQVEKIKEILNNIVPRHKSFNYWLDHLGGFPNAQRPNVLVAKVGEDQAQSVRLHAEIYTTLKEKGLISETRLWQPHITLGRIKNEPIDIKGLDKIKLEKTSWPVTEIVLMKSELLPRGPVYTILGKYLLNSGN